jgi:hypothetical protein
MMSTKKHKGKLPPFVPVIRTTMASPSWKAMSFGARCLYTVLRGYLRHDNANNGKVFRSHRDVCLDLGTRSRRSVVRWFRELQHYGFIVQTTGAHLGVDGDGLSAHWRLTECPSFDAKGNLIAATRDFDRWDGALFDDPSKTESRVPKGSGLAPLGVHTGTAEIVGIDPEVGPKGVHRLPPRWVPKGSITCCHSLTPLQPYGRGPGQGGDTLRPKLRLSGTAIPSSR